MVRCVVCPKFTRKTCHCSYYNKTINPDDIHKQISCPGYPNDARRKWLLAVAERKALPQAYYQILETKS